MDLEEVVSALPVGIAVISRDLKYQCVNQHYSEMIGKQGHEIIGEPVYKVLPPAVLEMSEPYIDRVLEGYRVEFGLSKVEGLSISNREVCYSPLKSSGGFVATFSQEKVQSKYFRMGVESTITTLNHHINNPLSIILSELIQANKSSNLDEIKEELTRVNLAAGRIVATLRKLSKSEDLKLKEYTKNSQMFDLEND